MMMGTGFDDGQWLRVSPHCNQSATEQRRSWARD